MKFRAFLLPAICAGLLLPAALSAAENDRPARPPQGEQRGKAADRMAAQLGLSDEQRTQMQEIATRERAELQALRDAGENAPEERRARAQAVREKYRAERDAILTPEQRTKAKEMRGKFQQRDGRKGKGPGRPKKGDEQL